MKILVTFGGMSTSLAQGFWERLESRLNLRLAFGCSIWQENRPDFTEWVSKRLVFEHMEQQSYVTKSCQIIAEKIEKHPEETRPFNTLMMWHKWRELGLKSELHQYDLIIKTRPDVDYQVEHLEALVRVLEQFSASEALKMAIPDGGDHRGGMNDIFSIGRPVEMQYYLSIMDFYQDYYQNIGEFHPERMLRYHLIDKGHLSVLRFPLEISLRGTTYNANSHKRFVDKLPVFPSFFRRKVEKYKRQGKVF